MDTNVLFQQNRAIITPTPTSKEMFMEVIYKGMKYILYNNWYLQIVKLDDRSVRAIQGKDKILDHLNKTLTARDYSKFEMHALLHS